MSETQDREQVRAALDAKEEQLEQEIAELTAPHQNMGNISFGKRVGDGTSMAVERLSAVHAHDRLTAMLEEVRRARAALDDGTWGTCVVCGDPIAEARLEARPWATRCVGCAASAGPR